LFFNFTGPHRNVPDGTTTVPPPAADAALMAFNTAVVLFEELVEAP
jgi:hypothetical protein